MAEDNADLLSTWTEGGHVREKRGKLQGAIKCGGKTKEGEGLASGKAELKAGKGTGGKQVA